MRKFLLAILFLCLLSLPAIAQQPQGGVTGPAGPACADPSCVASASLELWLKADAVTMHSDGDPLVTWSDSSGNGNTATASMACSMLPSGAVCPLYQTNEINSLPAVEFESAGAGLPTPYTFADFASGFTAGDIFVVVKTAADPASDPEDAGLWSFGTAGDGNLYPWTDGTVYEDFGSTVRKTVGDLTPSLASWRLYEVWSAPSDYAALLDGTSVFTTATNTVAFTATPALGMNDIGVSYAFRGKVAEVIFFNGKLSAGDRTIIKAYIASKYALTIS